METTETLTHPPVKSIWQDVSREDWNDWHWQIHNCLRDVEALKTVIPLTQEEEDGVKTSLKSFRMAITPYYASLIDTRDATCPIRLQAVPRGEETTEVRGEMDDSLHEDVDMPVPGLTHRYPDRVLLLVTEICSMYCRHCTRRRKVGESDAHLDRKGLERAFDYIREHKEVRDIVVSGGDPLTLSDSMIEFVLQSLRAIPHVEIIRIGTRTPVVMPMRITEDLCHMIQKYHPVYINTHFNHPKELTPDAKQACERLANHGVPLGNQSVLLRYVNDCPHVMKELVQGLLRFRVKPYYVYQCDDSKGIHHFRTPLSRGVEIIESLRGHTSGMAVPTFVVDVPGGGGKVPVMPNYLVSQSPGQIILRNYEGMFSRYFENADIDSGCGRHEACHDSRYQPADGPALMMQPNGPMNLIPANTQRKSRKDEE